ncbi:MAG: hypothetical protein ABJA82_18410 [Myxococcales bacterium]
MLLVAVLGVVGTMVTGCAAPAPLVSLRPRAAPVVWVAGRASIRQEQDGVTVATAFEHQDGDKLAVRVEVQNGTDQQIEVGPRRITFMTCTDPTPTSCSRASRVVDPEAALAAIDQQRSLEEADAQNTALLNGSLLLLSAVSDVATVASGKPDRTTGLQTAAAANEMENDRQRRDSALSSFAAQRQLWSNAAFRRTTLFPSSGHGGLVFIPIDLQTRYLWVDVWGPDQRRFRFQFEQVITPVVPPDSEDRGSQSSIPATVVRK